MMKFKPRTHCSHRRFTVKDAATKILETRDSAACVACLSRVDCARPAVANHAAKKFGRSPRKRFPGAGFCRIHLERAAAAVHPSATLRRLSAEPQFPPASRGRRKTAPLPVLSRRRSGRAHPGSGIRRLAKRAYQFHHRAAGSANSARCGGAAASSTGTGTTYERAAQITAACARSHSS